MQQPYVSRRSRQPPPSSGSFTILSPFRRPSLRNSLLLLGALLLLARYLSHRTSSTHARKLQSLFFRQPNPQSAATSRAVSGSAISANSESSAHKHAAGAGLGGGGGPENKVAGGGNSGAGNGAAGGARAEAEGAKGAGMVRLWNGVMMPRLGFGTAGLGGATEQAVGWALEAGYRLLDSAQAREWYREDAVGAAIARHNISRNQLFLVSKLHPRHHGYTVTRERFRDSLRDLRVSHLDLFLLHYPFCFPAICGGDMPGGGGELGGGGAWGGGGGGAGGEAGWVDSWRALEDLYERGAVRAIGVSNFGREELTALLAMAQVKPHVLQRNSDPLKQDRDLQALCVEHGITYMAYSSLGSQHLIFSSSPSHNPVLAHPTITATAARRACSPAQVVLKWGLLKGQVVIPRSGNKEHIRENHEAWRCGLDESDVAAIDRLDGTLDGAER